MSCFLRTLLYAVVATLEITISGCGGGSTTTPVATDTGDISPVVEVAVTWPAGLPADALQPWETLDSEGRVSACLNADSEFLAGCEHFFDCTTGITDLDESVHIESGEPGSGLVAWVIYRVVMGGEQPGVVTTDVNPGVMSDGGLSEYYIGLSDYGGGQWDWHGPFIDNHVRLSTGAEVRAGGDYLSELGNHFVCVVAFDGATIDVVGVATNSYDETDTAAPPVPTGLHAFPAYGALDIHWDDVLAGDLAGYRLYWSEADFTAPEEAGVNCVDYLIGQGSYLLTDLPATTIRVRVSAVDISGNESALSDQTSVLVYEGAGPELRLGISTAGALLNDTITLTAAGATNYAWDLDGDGTYEITGDTTGIQSADTGRTGVIRPSVRGTTDDESCVSCSAVSLVVTSNSRPVASALADPAMGSAPLLVTLTGNGLDNDGTIASWSWDFDGDGTYDRTDLTDPGPVGHTYTVAGMYNAKFRVEDDMGSWDVDTVSILVNPGANHAPEADLVIGAGEASGDLPHSVHFDASGSVDPDPGDSVQTYYWDFDGDQSYERITFTPNLAYTYTDPGVFNALVTVEDTAGARDSASVEITISVVGNDDPVADLTSNVSSGDAPLAVHFDATGSTDSDGTIVMYEWDWERDGIYDGYGTVPAADHTYTAAGVYNCRVRVTDDDGAQSTDFVEITVSVPGNADPVADLAPATDSGDAPYTVSFDASGSSDTDGTIVLYEWDFDNDGNYDGYGTDPTIDHTYDAGSYTARLRVTDDDGAQGTDTATIDVNDPPVADLQASVEEIESSEDFYLFANGSTDSDGTIVDYEWDLNDDWVFGVSTSEIQAAGLAVIQNSESKGGYYSFNVRVTDDDGAQATATIQVLVHGWGYVTLDSAGDVGEYTSIANVGGCPAIAYRDTTNQALKYILARDSDGYDWNDPQVVDDSVNAGSYASMVVVDGNPAVSYRNQTDTCLRYVRATDPAGLSWGSPLDIDTAGNVGNHNSLCVINGNPAIAYYDGTNDCLKYVRATGATGSTWDTPLTVDSGGDVGKYACLREVNGRPAISYYSDSPDYDLYYIRSSDAIGSTWGTPVNVASAGNVGMENSLCVVDGYPAICYWRVSSIYLWYVRATDANGDTWASPGNFNIGGMCRYCSMGILDGKPVVSFFYYGDDELCFVEAQDSTGSSWNHLVVIDDSISKCGEYTSLVVINDAPMISYYYDTGGDLRFARLF